MKETAPTEIQLHDAVIKYVLLMEGGKLKIGLLGVTVYFTKDPSLLDTWIHNATLNVDGLKKLSYQGEPWSEAKITDYIMTDVATGPSGQEVRWVHSTEISVIKLFIASGAVIEIECSRADIKLSRRREYAGVWEDR